MMADALRATGEAIGAFLVDLPLWAWAVVLGVLLLAMVAVALRMVAARQRGKPEMVLSRAELTPDGHVEGYYQLVAAFSNMHHDPVQLLRLSVQGANGERQVVETTALVGPRRAVELEASVPVAPGGTGRLDLYLYVPSAPSRAWRLTVPLDWEPGSKRFKAAPLKQKLHLVRKLPEQPAPAPDGEVDPPEDARREGGPLRFPDEF